MGPVHAGSSFGDFSTIELPDGKGWVVTCHHNDILTFVGPDEMSPGSGTSAWCKGGNSSKPALEQIGHTTDVF